MAWKPGDRVTIVSRQATQDDCEAGLYYSHLASLTGTVQLVYGKDEVAVMVDPGAFDPLLLQVHTDAVRRMRSKFLDSLSEEQKKKLSDEERKFDANYVVLVRAKDLEKGPKTPPKAKTKRPAESEPEDYDGTSVKQGVLYDDPTVPDAHRRSMKEIEAAEEEELRNRSN